MRPEDFSGGEHLALSCTQTSLSAKDQKALVQAWCEALPTLKSVRVVWFFSRVPQNLFEAACQMPGLRQLYIKWSGIASLMPLAAVSRLTHLHLGSSPSAAPLTVFEQLPHLQALSLENIRAAADLSFVQALPGLRSLAIAGDRNSIKHLPLKSLAPLAALQKLEELSLSVVRLEDPSLAVLSRLPRLHTLWLSNQFLYPEVARLAGLRPDIACDRFAAVSDPVSGIGCRHCGQGGRMVMLCGKGQPWACSVCHPERIEKHRARFEAIRQAAAAEAAAQA